MTMQWPFSLARPGSYGPLSVPTPDELQMIQEQAALAADGRAWTDVAALKSWQYTLLSASILATVPAKPHVYDPTTRRWLVFGELTGEAAGAWSISGARWLATPTGAMASLQAVSSAAVSPAGKILVGGPPSSGASASKLRESTNGGASWTGRNIGSADAQNVSELAFSSALGLWFASVGGNGGSGLFSSPDGVTWTLRHAAGGPPFYITPNEGAPSPIVIGTRDQSVAASTGYYRSINGTSWTNETFPVTLVGSSKPTYHPLLGKFFVPAAAGIYSSSTGLTGSWTLVDNTFTGTGGLASFGRWLVRGDGRISLSGGVGTWIPVLELANNDLVVIAAPGVGVLFVRGTPRDLYLSQQLGF
jgi:hypothetical protein